MANDFNASLVISTTEAVNSIRNVDAASKDLDKTLAHLHTTMTANQGDMDKISKSLKDFTVAQSTSNKNSATRQQNLVREAGLEGKAIANQNKLAEGTQRQSQHEAKLAGIRAGGGRAAAAALGAETRRNSESSSRIANAGILTTQRAVTETERYTAAQHRTAGALATRGAAEDRAALTTLRLQSAQDRARNSNLALNDSLSNSRYLLYDVGQTYAMLSAALLAIPIATAAVAISYEKDFAQVIRTTGIVGEQIPELRNELKALGREIPLSFGQFSNIASIAGQLGIAKEELGAFTETVAKFGAASNVGIQDAATAFGRLENSFNANGKTPDFFNKVGSAIAKVGVESAASETEIIAVTNQISAAGAQFGFTADQIVGLSGALASVRIRPELARGAFQRIMLNLSRAADEGADSFDRFGKYTGLAGQASLDLFKNDPSAFFNKYIAGIKGTIASGASVSSVLDDIGAKNVFDKQFILGLANGMNVYNKALSDSKGAFDEGTFLDSSTKGVFETFAATITKIGTSMANLADTLANGAIAGLIGDVAEVVLGVVSSVDRLATASKPFALVISSLLSLGAVVGVFLAFRAAQAFVIAGLIGLQQVMGRTAIAGAFTLRGSLMEVSKTMLMAKGASAELAMGLLAGRTGMSALMFATTTTTGAIQRFAAAGTLAGYALSQTAAKTGFAAVAMRGFSSALSMVGGPIGALLTGLALVAIGFVAAEEKASQAGDAIARAMKNGAEAGNRAIIDALTDRTVDSYITDRVAGGVGNHGKNVRQIAEEVGVDFKKVVAAIATGEDATKEFQKVQDAFSVGKGFKDFQDLKDNSNNLQNSRGEMIYLGDVVAELAKKQVEANKDIKAGDEAIVGLGGSANTAAPGVEGLSDDMGDLGGEADKAATAIKNAVDAIFGIIDAEAATQDSLSKLGAGLADSTSFNVGTDGGRENTSNLKDTLRNAALEQQQMVDSGEQTMQQASANYVAFIDGLIQQLVAKGVDPTQIQGLADQAKGIFGTSFASGTQPTIKPKVDGTQVAGEAVKATNATQQVLDLYSPTLKVITDSSEAKAKITGLASSLAVLTGWPYNVVVDALTDPASEKGKELALIMTKLTQGSYVVPVNASTDAAKANVKNFADYASKQLAAIQNAYNQVAASAPTLAKYSMGSFKGVKGVTNSAPEGIRAAPVAKIAAPSDIVAKGSAPDFPGLVNGYDKAAKAAQKAGEKGKKAGEDMANGIDDATTAANDYASRLKAGLTSAFDKQYGLTKATDEYHSALNAITKKREDELAQLDDLVAKQKELNNSRNEDLTNARKAGTEKAISQKYGEVDRAADYAQQEEEALLAAAAKQKDIDANNKTSVSLKAGMGNFEGYSEAAIANREALRNLESKMLDMISAYAATGATQEQVRAYAQRLTAQFQTDAAQVYNNRVQISALTGGMGRYIGVVNAVPPRKNTLVTADTDGASNDIAGLQNQVNNLPKDTEMRLHWKMTSYARPVPDYKFQGQQVYRVYNQDGSSTGQEFFNKGGQVQGYAGGGMIPGRAPSDPSIDNRMASVDGKGMIKVRSGEFIVQQPAVDYWGLDMFKNLNNMKMPAFNAGGSVGGGRNGGAGSNGPVLVELTAENIAAIQRLPQISLYADNVQLAKSVSQGNTILASQGAN